MFAAEVARGDLRRSSLNEFLETSRDASSQLVANLNRAAELIQSFKQVAADRNYSDQRMFDLGDLTEQVVMSLRPGLRKHNLTLNVDCQPNLTMNSYPGPYGQVLTNLFLNAVAHAFPDGKAGRGRYPGAGIRQGQCRDPLLRQWRRHEPRRPPPRLRSVLHHAARPGRHRARACTSSTAS